MPHDSNFFYRRGTVLGLIPTPTETTATQATGTGTVSASVVTDSTASFAINSLIQRLVEIDSSSFIIISNTETTFTVNGTPTTGSQTYTIFKRGLEIWYTQLPNAVVDDTEELPGEAEDHFTLVYGVLERVLKIMGKNSDSEYYRQLYSGRREERRVEFTTEQDARMLIEPWNLRSDLA